ncbi:MAG: dipeptidyl aminopeptidase/acylaminoacyl peptidase, partial [Nitrospinales bacterium]
MNPRSLTYKFSLLLTTLLLVSCRGRVSDVVYNDRNIIDLSTGNQFTYVNNDIETMRTQMSVGSDYKFDIIDNIQYADYDERYSGLLSLDIYKPFSNTKRPLIIFVHSGGFITGAKDGYVVTKYCNDFAEKGYVVASVNYRLVPS